MSDLYMGTIVVWPISYNPEWTMFCQGQQMPVNQYQAMFSLLGVTYGGNGTTNFNLPDLRARIPLGLGQGQYTGAPPPVALGQTGGSAIMTANVTSNGAITLNANNLPSHSHTATFSPTLGPVQVPISQAGSLGVNIPVGTTIPGTNSQTTLSAPIYLSNGQAGNSGFKGVFVNSPPNQTVSLATTGAAGATVTGTAGVTANPTINVVTGGQVAVGNTGAGTPAPVQVVGQVSGSNFQPSLGLNFLLWISGIYPSRQ